MKQTPYIAARKRVKPQRLVVFMPQAELTRIDDWGVAGLAKSRRSEAVRELLGKSLELAKQQSGSD